MIGNIWNTVFKQPILQALLWLSALTGNLGVAIVLLTIIIQLVLLPLRLPSLRSTEKIRSLKPELDKLKEKHKNDNMAMAQAQMELYKTHNVSPFGSIIPTLLSIPVIIALYQVLLSSLGTIENVGTHFLWLDVTAKDPFYILPILVAVAQFIMSSMTMTASAPKSQDNKGEKKGSGDPADMATMMQGQMRFIFPLFSAFITATLPSGVGLYWLTSTASAIIQQHLVRRQHNGSKVNSTTTN